MTEPSTIGDEGEILPGTSYRLVKRLGGGGMGSVFIAEHTALGRRDAVKLLAPHIAEDEQAMKRLEREARATAALANPHIIDIYTLGVTTDKRPYVAMRLIPGISLKQLLDREKRLDVDRAWNLLRQVCVALESAHEAGIIHRDLKPDNLMVEPRDAGEFVTILDFGIAKVEAEIEARLTQDGQVIGTPGYMAPEQALGRAVDRRADEYSIGAIFYELVSGGFPYERMGMLQTITQQITQPARPISGLVTEAEVPAALQALIMQALSREAGDRLPSLSAFVQAVDAAIGYVAPAASRTRLTMESLQAVSPGAIGAIEAPRRTGFRLWGPPLALAVGVGVSVAVFVSLGKKDTLPAPGDEPSASKVDAPVSAGPSVTPPPEAVRAGPAALAGATPASVGLPVGGLASAATSAGPVAASSPATDGARPSAGASASVPAPRPAAPRTSSAPVGSTPPVPTPVAGDAPVGVPVAAPPTAAPTAPPLPAALVAAPVTAAPVTAPPPAAPPRLVVGAVQIIGGGSATDIKRRVGAAEATIRACLAATPGLKSGAAAVVDFVIDEDGFFGEPKMSGDGLLSRCARQAVKGARLDRRPDTGDVRVSVPLRLEAP